MTLLDTLLRPAAFRSHSIGAKFSSLEHLYDVWRQRQALRKLDIDALNDIGISRKDAFAEARRPVWDAPSTWRN